MFMKRFVMIASLLGFWGVASGAFGAHALKGSLSTYELGIWQTAVNYLLFHVPVMLFAIVLPNFMSGVEKTAKYSFISFAFGCAVFSVSLQVLAITGTKWLGAITPIGGMLLLIGWVLLFVTGWKGRLKP